MTSGQQTRLGKAFEYACLIQLKTTLANSGHVRILENSAVENAKEKFESVSETESINFLRAAQTAVKFLIKLEPKLKDGDINNSICLTLQPDSAGISGDVRDVICKSEDGSWEVGLSCKHNHSAVKHSRLSNTIDFGEKWFGYACTSSYFEEIRPLFDKLEKIRNDSNRSALWQDLSNKEEDYYKPLLKAFMKELKNLAEIHQDVPKKLIRYLIGEYDFYKIITNDRQETTKLEAINLIGTLNQNSANSKALVNVPLLSLPTRFYHIDFVPGSSNTIEVVCDEGWSVSMRIHNASSRIEPSLKFDVQLKSMPHSIFSQIDHW